MTAVTLLATSCKKERIDEHPDFVGDWGGESGGTNYAISISANGQASYEATTASSEVWFNGKFGVKGDKVAIGLKKLSIDVYPERWMGNNMGVWTMTLDGVQYYALK